MKANTSVYKIINSNRVAFIVIIALLSLLSGCAVISFYPLYTSDVLLRDDRIIGNWFTVQSINSRTNSADTLIWEVSFDEKLGQKTFLKNLGYNTEQDTNLYSYTLNVHIKSKPETMSKFQVHLVKLGNKTYFDFYPIEWSIEKPVLDFHLIGVHTFAKVDIHIDYININWFNQEILEEGLKENKIRIKHEKNALNTLLTAQPKDLQKFILKYSEYPKAFDEKNIYKLKPIK